MRWHEPLPWHPGEEIRLPFLFSAGIWCAVVLGVGFIGVYASRVAEEARQLSDALAATELVLAREQHLTQLDGLAAAAAHELGTPLATITLVVREMLGLVAKAGPTIDVAQIADDIRLLDQEAQRCRAILGKLTSLGTEDAGPLGRDDAEPPRRGGGRAAAQLRRGRDGDADRLRRRARLRPQPRDPLRARQPRRERRRLRPAGACRSTPIGRPTSSA